MNINQMTNTAERILFSKYLKMLILADIDIELLFLIHL